MIHAPAFLLVLISYFATASAAVYHLDPVNGDDAADGLTPQHAWRSLEKANASELKPGDQLLFKSGGRWSGQFKPIGGGDAKTRVLVGCYGDGPLPRIDGGGLTPDAILLQNISFIDLTNLEVTNLGPKTAPWRTGVRVLADGSGRMQGIRLHRLYVHDVNGDLRKSHEGCGIFFEAKGARDSHFDGLLIEECRVERTDRNGICQKGTGRMRSANIVIRGNRLENIGGDGIKLWGTNGGLIEKNVVRRARARCGKDEAAAGIWPFACDDTIIQFNEVSDTVGTKDGQGYDSDYWCRRTVFQYNYSFRNEGGFMLICAPGNAVNEDTVIRYNISIHDGINSARVFQFGGGAARTHVYNNTVILSARQNLPLLSFNEWNRGTTLDSRFSNNLFIVEEGGRATYQFNPSKGNVFENNLFCGRHVGLPAGTAISPTPRLLGPIDPAPGFASLQGCRPADAARFPRGTIVGDNGGRDFFGNPVPADRPPAIGAAER
jgi:hypothetical protein